MESGQWRDSIPLWTIKISARRFTEQRLSPTAARTIRLFEGAASILFKPARYSAHRTGVNLVSSNSLIHRCAAARNEGQPLCEPGIMVSMRAPMKINA